LAGILAALVGQTALARQEPTPPPSGVVVHLFGQDSVMSNVLPTAPVRPAVSGQIYPGAGPQADGAPAQGAYVEPTMGDVLHQLFVTGDPDAPVENSAGRSKNRLAN
jgi:hypothetical protein